MKTKTDDLISVALDHLNEGLVFLKSASSEDDQELVKYQVTIEKMINKLSKHKEAMSSKKPHMKNDGIIPIWLHV